MKVIVDALQPWAIPIDWILTLGIAFMLGALWGRRSGR